MTPNILVEWLRSCRRPQRVQHVLVPGLPGAGRYLSMTRGPRLLLGLQGRRHCLVRTPDGPRALHVDAASALVLAPGAAVMTSPDAPFVSMGATAADDDGSVTVGRYPTARNPNPGGQPSLFVQSHRLSATAAAELGDLLRACCHRQRPETDLVLRQAVAAAVSLLIEAMQAEGPVRDAQQRRIDDLVAFIRAHPEQDLGRDQVADRLGCHPNHVARVFQRELGCSFRDFVIRARLDRARDLMRDPTLPLERIAELCGWARASTLIAHHRRVYGVTPRSIF